MDLNERNDIDEETKLAGQSILPDVMDDNGRDIGEEVL